MVKDRLHDLIKVRNEKQSDVNLEIPEERVPLTGPNLKQTFENAEVIKEWIESIERNTDVLRGYSKKLDDLSINQRDLNDKIESLFSNNISISNQIQTKLKAFEEDLQNINPLDAEGRIKNIQYNTLKTRYQNAFKQNATELERFRHIKKQQLKAQIRAKGISVTEDQLLQLIDEKTDVHVFTENILAQTANAKRELQDIEERHQQLMKIETMLGEIRDLFLHMAILVDTQQELIDRVEYQAGMAQNFVEKSRNDLKKGEKRRKRHIKSALPRWSHWNQVRIRSGNQGKTSNFKGMYKVFTYFFI
ncbi:syntaxin-like isoform X1 [Rhynchophorus ferrugineus]|uniref:syntaxin-like isoform X1 n=1 Tax=Rhynchophorus ferrugineus TaxID=354439 RepID=UPI003FCC89FF